VAVAAALAASCSSRPRTGPAQRPSGKPVIYTTFYPTTYFARTIGGDAVEVVCPCPPDEDAIFWRPDPDTIAAYQGADLIVINGAEFEKWVLAAVLPEEKTVDSAKGLSGGLISFEHAVTHSHGPAGEHSHEGIDGHTWVDPVNALAQAAEIEKAMSSAFPEHAERFRRGFATLKVQLEELDRAFKELSASGADTPILCSHPAYNYIARRYEWKVRNLDLDPEQKLTDEQIEEVRTALKTHAARHLVWEGQPADEVVEQVRAKLGLQSVVFSPCELMGPAELKAGASYMTVMRENIEAMRAVMASR
jgi:zinc transport system substrate-binding protein